MMLNGLGVENKVMKKSYPAYEIEQAFRKVREAVAFGSSVDFANGSNFTIREVEQMEKKNDTERIFN